MNERLTVVFYGRVQGVSFRYTTAQIAKDYLVAGNVRNRTDGTVLLLAEGKREDLQAFLDAIRERFDENIREFNAEWSEPSNQFIEFDVNY